MRILKKSLALCLTLAIALMAMCGCLVSADTTTIAGTITAGNVEITTEDTSVVVPITVEAASGIVAARVNVDLPEGLTIIAAEFDAELTDADVLPFETEDASDYNLDDGIFLIETALDKSFTKAVINITVEGTFAAGTVVVDVENLTGVEGADYDETPVDFDCVDGSIVVSAPLGSEQNPHVLSNMQKFVRGLAIAPDETVYFRADFLVGNEIEAAFTDIDANEVTDYTISITGAIASIDETFTITNNSDATIYGMVKVSPALGSMDNPEIIEETKDYTPAETDGYHYQFTAIEDGSVTITMKDENDWALTVNNAKADGSYSYGDIIWSEDNVGAYTETIALSAGDVITIIIGSNMDDVDDDAVINWNFTIDEAAVEVNVADYIPNPVITNSVDQQAVNGKCTYTAAESKELALAIDSLGGRITQLGVKVAWDGSDVTASTYAFKLDVPERVWTTFLSDGYAIANAGTGYFKGMNIYQMADTNVQFVNYVTYTTAEGDVTVYGDVVSQVLMDYLKTQSDAKSVAIVNAYELASAATSSSVTAATELFDENYGPTMTLTYDLKKIQVRGQVAFTKAQTNALAVALNAEGKRITQLGVKITWDGSDPTTSETSAKGKLDVPENVWSTFVSQGYAIGNAGASYYQGMNVAQFASEIKFIAYYECVDAEGVTSTVYLGDVYTTSFNEVIADDTSDLAVAYQDMYNAFN